MIEEWKEINGFEGKYWISNLGRVRGIKSTLNLNLKIQAIRKLIYTSLASILLNLYID